MKRRQWTEHSVGFGASTPAEKVSTYLFIYFTLQPLTFHHLDPLACKRERAVSPATSPPPPPPSLACKHELVLSLANLHLRVLKHQRAGWAALSPPMTMTTTATTTPLIPSLDRPGQKRTEEDRIGTGGCVGWCFHSALIP